MVACAQEIEISAVCIEALGRFGRIRALATEKYTFSVLNAV